MLNIKIICVGKLKEKFYSDAVCEYTKRLGAYCRLDIAELPEVRRSADPSPGEIEAALAKEAAAIRRQLVSAGVVITLCIEGRQMNSESFSQMMEKYASNGVSRLYFIIGGSDGLHESIKKESDRNLSMSEMTFPHHLARVMLLEQIYRGFKIIEGGRYHK